MAELLILQFDGVTEEQYRNVSKELGIDPDTMKGDWPAGLITHIAGMNEDGHGCVVETWTSREAQAAFMESRLGAAMGRGGVTATPTVTWATVVGEHHSGG